MMVYIKYNKQKIDFKNHNFVLFHFRKEKVKYLYFLRTAINKS